MSNFPSNIVQVIKDTIAADAELGQGNVVGRAVRPADPNYTVGVYADNWEPVEGSHQIGQHEPALNRYSVTIQDLVQSQDEQIGREVFATRAKLIRVTLYRSPDFRIALTSLNEDVLNSRERLQHFGVTRQRFVMNELKGIWNFVSVTQFWIETEIVQF
jgi:hypothetical protein